MGGGGGGCELQVVAFKLPNSFMLVSGAFVSRFFPMDRTLDLGGTHAA